MTLNPVQQEELDRIITPYLSAITETLASRPDQLRAVLELLKSPAKISYSHMWQLQEWGIFEEVDFFRAIDTHACPENRTAGNIVLEISPGHYAKPGSILYVVRDATGMRVDDASPHAVPYILQADDVIYLELAENGKTLTGFPKIEKRGLLGLSAKNIVSELDKKITKKDVTDYINQTVTSRMAELHVPVYPFKEEDELNALLEETFRRFLPYVKEIKEIHEALKHFSFWDKAQAEPERVEYLLKYAKTGQLQKALLTLNHPEGMAMLYRISDPRKDDKALKVVLSFMDTIKMLAKDDAHLIDLIKNAALFPVGAEMLLTECQKHSKLLEVIKEVRGIDLRYSFSSSETVFPVKTSTSATSYSFTQLGPYFFSYMKDVLQLLEGKKTNWIDVLEGSYTLLCDSKKDVLEKLYTQREAVQKLLPYMSFKELAVLGKDVIARKVLHDFLAYPDAAVLFLEGAKLDKAERKRSFLSGEANLIIASLHHFQSMKLSDEVLKDFLKTGKETYLPLLTRPALIQQLTGREAEHAYVLLAAAEHHLLREKDPLLTVLETHASSVNALIEKRKVHLHDLIKLGRYSTEALEEVCLSHQKLQVLKRHKLTMLPHHEDKDATGEAVWRLTKKLLWETSPEWVHERAARYKAPTEEERKMKAHEEQEALQWQIRLMQHKENQKLMDGMGQY